MADDIDGKRISDSHLRQLALVMKILNGANRKGTITDVWVGCVSKNGRHH